MAKMKKKKQPKQLEERVRNRTASPNGGGGLDCHDHDMPPSISYSEYKSAFQAEKYLDKYSG